MKKILGLICYVHCPPHIRLLVILFCIFVILTLEDVYESLHSKETMKQLVNRSEAKDEGLIARGRL